MSTAATGSSGGCTNEALTDLSLRTYGRVTQPGDFANVTILSKNGYPVKIGDAPGEAEAGGCRHLGGMSKSGSHARPLPPLPWGLRNSFTAVPGSRK